MIDMSATHTLKGQPYVRGKARGPVIASALELSFWGGVDPVTGEVIDRHHPLSGRHLTDHILAIPGGRGSCTGSGVLLELLLNGKGPKAMLFEREEDILTLGVIIAEELFETSIPVVVLSPADFQTVLHTRAVSISDGKVTCLGEDDAWTSVHSSADPVLDEAVDRMRLSDLDKALLAGNLGKAPQIAMRIILRMARLLGASGLMDVAQVHIDGCIYTGSGSLAFAERLRELGGRVVVPTSLNAISVDSARWRSQGIDPAFGDPASRLAEAYVDMGARPTFTCAPYLLDTAPKFGSQVAWAESNAVVYANSVLGARTMKYPDFLDICIALTGRAPAAGAHLSLHRGATLEVAVHAPETIDDAFYPLLGYRVGELAANRIPVITGLEHSAPSLDDLKAFGAAFATVSSAPMFHIAGVTPEAPDVASALSTKNPVESKVLTARELAASFEELNTADDGRVDLIALGNPHFSFSEIEKLASLCRGRVKHADTAVIVTSGRAIYERAREQGLVAELERFGVQFVTDTCWCMITDPLIPPAARIIMTNSGKFAHYGPGLTGRRFFFGSLQACVDAAVAGEHHKALPLWLQ